MKLRPVRHVLMLARHLHYKKAADELGLTQPALSRSIQMIEEFYGTKLFDRDRGGVQLTPIGRLFVERAEALLREAADFDRVVREYASGDAGHLAFGISPSCARACLPTLLAELVNDRPRLRVNVAVRRTSALLPMLVSEDIEFLICSRNEIRQSSGISFTPLGTFTACYLVRPGHPLLHDDQLDLTHFPIIATGPFQGADDVMRGLFDFLAQRPQVTVESPDALARLAQTTDAVWMSSTFGAAAEIADGTLVRLDGREFDHDHPVEIGLYAIQQRSETSMIREIVERLRRIFALTGHPQEMDLPADK